MSESNQPAGLPHPPTVRTGIAFVPLTADSHPCLVHLNQYRDLATTTAYCGVPLTEMTRDELLAFAAMQAQQWLDRRGSFPV